MSFHHSSSDDILLVPSAIQVPPQLYLDVGSIPTGMIPLEGKPMLEHLAEAYSDYDVSRVVVVGESADSIREYISRSKYEWTTIEAYNTSSLGETIYTALDTLDVDKIDDTSMYINFADTLVSPIREVKNKNIISYKKRKRTYRWTTFEIDDGRIVNPTRKNKHTDKNMQPCFTGQFGIRDAKTFYRSLQKISHQNEDGIGYFYRGLLLYLESTEYELYEPDSWIDVGHLDTYHRSKKRFLNAREFNEFENRGKNTITKRSEDTTTLINEIKWYDCIPSELQPYLPRIYDHSVDPRDPFLTMEYIGYPSLSDLQLYGAHRQHIWNDVFHRVFNMYHEFKSFTADSTAENRRQALKEIYLDKTRRRLVKLRDNEHFNSFFGTETVWINGEAYPSISRILEKLEKIVSEYNLLSLNSFSVIHGDLCFPNILYDPRNEILKLIDPRGKFGQFNIYGDPKYDLAKLRHSVVGHYEHLINDQFEIESNNKETCINYNIYTTDRQKKREKKFEKFLSGETSVDPEAVRLIEALLFLSMVLLHRDDYERQQCMLAQGIEKFSPFLE